MQEVDKEVDEENCKKLSDVLTGEGQAAQPAPPAQPAQPA